MEENNFANLPNLRRVPGSRLYRAAVPDELTPDELERLRDVLGVRHVVDFRNEYELPREFHTKPLSDKFILCKAEREGNRLRYTMFPKVDQERPENRDQLYDNNIHFLVDMLEPKVLVDTAYRRAAWYLRLWLSMLYYWDVVFKSMFFIRGMCKYVMARNPLSKTHIDILDTCHDQLHTALALLCDPENSPALVCCQSGRDRSGLMAALIMACLGASDAQIVDDYARSKAAVETSPIKEMLQEAMSRRSISKFHPSHLTAHKSDMEDVLAFINKKYGSMAQYLDTIGFDERMRGVLRQAIGEEGAKDAKGAKDKDSKGAKDSKDNKENKDNKKESKKENKAKLNGKDKK